MTNVRYCWLLICLFVVALSGAVVGYVITTDACAGEKLLVECPDAAAIEVTSAVYGYNASERSCSAAIGNASEPAVRCHTDVTTYVQLACSGEETCELTVPDRTWNVTGQCHDGSGNSVQVNYTCQQELPIGEIPDHSRNNLIELVADSSIVQQNGTITLRCVVDRFDDGMFVRYNKWSPHHETGSDWVPLTTNVMKEQSIRSLQRYSIKAASSTSGTAEYDFVLTVTGAKIEDGGVYQCAIPQLNVTRQVNITVIGDPISVQLVVDGRVISRDGEMIDFDDVAGHNISCTAVGGNPQPFIAVSVDDRTLHSDDVSRCRVEPSKDASFLDHVVCNWTATVSDVVLNYNSVRLPVTCSAQSRRVNSKPLSISFITMLPGDLPIVTCPDKAMKAINYKQSVKVLCQVESYPPLTDAYVHWHGGHILRPQNWQNGIKMARDGHFVAYARPQAGNFSLIELYIDRIYPQMYRTYYFTAVNHFGATEDAVSIETDPSSPVARTGESRSSKSSGNCARCRHDVTSVAYLLSLLVSFELSLSGFVLKRSLLR